MMQRPNSSFSTEPRVCLFSNRHLIRFVWRCADYEFEDVICEIDEVELLVPEPYRSFPVRQKFANQLARHLSVAVNPGVKKTRLKRKYDVFVAICRYPRDLLWVNTVDGWKERCRTSVCWIEELWAAELHKWTGHLKILSKFDYVVLNCSGSVRSVREAVGQPCFYIPPGVDAIRFCPYPNPPARSIDVYSLGRRSPVIHQALIQLAEQRKIFYIYDTIDNNMVTFNHRQHRLLIAQTAMRARYFVANVAKFDESSETHGQLEIGPRFFEGAASGTVMIGEPPENEAFSEHLNWPDAVIRVPVSTRDIATVLADLDSQPDRLEEIRRNNVVQSLLRHDWLYRWEAILDIVDLKPKPALLARRKRLKKLAEMAEAPHDSLFHLTRTEAEPNAR